MAVLSSLKPSICGSLISLCDNTFVLLLLHEVLSRTLGDSFFSGSLYPAALCIAVKQADFKNFWLLKGKHSVLIFQPDGGPQNGIPSGHHRSVAPSLHLHGLQQGPQISSGLTLQQWQTTQAMQVLTEQALQEVRIQQPSRRSSGQIVRPWLRDVSAEVPPQEQPLQMRGVPHVPAVQALQTEGPSVPPQMLPFWREAAYAMYCQLCARQGLMPLPRDVHLPTPAAIVVTNLHPFVRPHEVLPYPLWSLADVALNHTR